MNYDKRRSVKILSHSLITVIMCDLDCQLILNQYGPSSYDFMAKLIIVWDGEEGFPKV